MALSSEFTGYIFHDLDYDKPFFSTYFKTSLFMVYLTGFLFHRPWREQCLREWHAHPQSGLARMRYQPVGSGRVTVEGTESDESGAAQGLGSPTYVPANIPSESGKSSGTESEAETIGRRVRFEPVAQVVEMNPSEALYANLARFFGNYCYQAALSHTEAAIVNVLSSSSCLFTLILSGLFPSEDSDRLTLSKVFAVLFSMTGVIFVSYSDLSLEGGFPVGALWTLLGSLFYSIYIVLLKRKVSHEDNMDTPMFFGFVGLFNAALLWPGLLVLHMIDFEALTMPTGTQLQFLVINGLVGTVFSELMWLWGCFYTSSLMATLAISLTIPMSVMADAFWKKKTYSPIFFVGAIPMFLSFFIVGMLAHYQDWDPVWDGCMACVRRFRGTVGPSSRQSYVFDRNERESLINQEVSYSSPDDHDDGV
eukprot:snap_masked-scaffold1057_size73593-processed-gene-0.8 protein:Tk01336 transcript:snap_masked-scaffold1057_size73593-processed-gene-0.8-mRNA-1 annotation:"solute carrier family 35 member f5-like"